MASYPLYYNEDGTIGKRIPMGNTGGYIQVNDARLVPTFLAMEMEIEEENCKFHELMMKNHVRAYRPNDRSVDTEKCKVTFWNHEDEFGYVISNLHLNPGDIIFIGSQIDGGRFAKITYAYEPVSDVCRHYGYKPLEKTMDSMSGRPFLTKLNYRPTFWEKVFGVPEGKLQKDICSSLDDVHIPDTEEDCDDLLDVI